MDLNRAFEQAINKEHKAENLNGVNALARLQRDYLELVANGTVSGPTIRPASPLGQQLRSLRGDLTLEEAAHKAQISVNTVQKLETGRTREIQLGTLNRLSNAYGLTPEQQTDLLKLAAEQSPQSRRRGPRRRP